MIHATSYGKSLICPAHLQKFPLLLTPNQQYIGSPSCPTEGVAQLSTRGGMRWTPIAKDDSADLRTAKSCGPDARRCVKLAGTRSMTVAKEPVTGESTK